MRAKTKNNANMAAAMNGGSAGPVTAMNHVRANKLTVSAVSVAVFIALSTLAYSLIDKRHFNFSDDPIDPLLLAVMMTSGVNFDGFDPRTPLAKRMVIVHLVLSTIGAALIIGAIVTVIPPRFRPLNVDDV